MANQLYPYARELFGNGQINWVAPATVIRAAILTSYVYSDLNQFYSAVDPANVIAVTAPLRDRTNVGGVMDAEDAVFIEPDVGLTVHACEVFVDLGTPAASPLILHFDTSTTGAIALLTDGGDVRFRWSNGPLKMFRL